MELEIPQSKGGKRIYYRKQLYKRAPTPSQSNICLKNGDRSLHQGV